MPVPDCAECSLVEQDMAGAFLHRQGFDHALGIQEHAQDDSPLLPRPSGLEGINRRWIVAVTGIDPNRTSVTPATCSASRAPAIKSTAAGRGAGAVCGAACARHEIRANQMWLRVFGWWRR